MDSGQYMCVFYRNQQKRYEKKGRRQLFGICLCILLAVSLIGGTFGEATPVRAETTGAGTEETEKKEETGENEGTKKKEEAKKKEAVQLQLYAQAAVLLDADSGRVLYGKNEEEVLPMASTTKIMTCILALEYGNPVDIVEISSYAASMPKVKLYMQEGEK